MEQFGTALAVTLIMALRLLWWVIIINAILSWLIAFNVLNARNQIVGLIWDFTGRVTAPLLNPIRRFMPNLGGVDISPIILLLAIHFLIIFISGFVGAGRAL